MLGDTPQTPDRKYPAPLFQRSLYVSILLFANNKMDNIRVFDDYVVNVILRYYTTLMSIVKPTEYSQDCVCNAK